MERAIRYGGLPFEVIAGTPRRRYGARITFRPRGDAGPAAAVRAAGGEREPGAALAAGFGLDRHPWGPPSWLGVRVRPDGTVDVKPYHALGETGDLQDLRERFASPAAPPDGLRASLRGELPASLPAGLPAGLHSVMASRHGGATELYLRLRPAAPWASFARAVTAAAGFGAGAADATNFSPHPQPAAEGYCMSLRWQAGGVAAVSLYADARALPGDDEVRRLWTAGMEEDERAAYEAALAGVRQLGRRGPEGWHALLGWTLEQDGGWHRAASLRVPAPAPAAGSL